MTDFEAWRDKIWEEEDTATPQAEPQDQGRGALGRRRHQRPAQAQSGPGARACRSCAPNASRQISRQGTAAMALEAGPKSGRKVIEAEGISKSFGDK